MSQRYRTAYTRRIYLPKICNTQPSRRACPRRTKTTPLSGQARCVDRAHYPTFLQRTFVIVQIYLLIFRIAILDEVFPFAPTIIIAVRVEYVQVAKLLELIESIGTKEVHANLPDFRPDKHILSVIQKRRLCAVNDRLQCCLSTTSNLSTCTSSIVDE